MDQQLVIQTLRAHEPELRAAGILRLRLFGSLARGQSSPASDVDLMADFDPAKSLSLLALVTLENRLAELLGVKVDLSSADSMKDYVLNDAVREAVLAF
ncbi:MAG TPA: nucleotidyltransferase family protein [Silvibacterium sp.]|nr:nucleotidyltransferase family protein [Silvibacterium sp.]